MLNSGTADLKVCEGASANDLDDLGGKLEYAH